MNKPEREAAELLEELCRLSPAQAVERLRGSGSVGETLRRLADATERLAISEVNRAIAAGAVLVALADVVGLPLEKARARRAQAQSAAYAGRFDEALPMCEAAIKLAAEAGDAVEAARARLAAVHPLVHFGRLDEALAAAEAARGAFEAANETLWIGRAESSIGGVHQRRDDPTAALPHFERARPLLVGDAVALAQLETNRGLALLSLDDFAGAEAAYRSALAAFEDAGLPWAQAIVEGNLAEVATRQGRLPEALRFFERARRHLDRDSAPAELARVLVEHADALLLLGWHEQAREQYEAALPQLERHGQVQVMLQAKAGLAAVLAATGRTAEARELLAVVARGYVEIGQPLRCARLDLMRSELTLAAGTPRDAYALAEQALHVVAARPAEAAAARYHLARAALATGDLVATFDQLDAALAIARRLDLPPLCADLLTARGQAERAAGNAQAAADDLRAAACEVERVRGALQAERFRAAFQANRTSLYAEWVGAALEVGGPAGIAEAYEAVQRAKSRALLDVLQGALDLPTGDESTGAAGAAHLRDKLRSRRGELNALYSRMADARFTDAPVGAEGWRSRVRECEREIDELEGRLAATREGLGVLAPIADLPRVQAQLPPGDVLLEYYTEPESLLTFVVTAKSACVERVPNAAAALNERIERVYFQLRQGIRPGAINGARAARRMDDVQRELRGLYEILVAPVRDSLAGARRLIVVPHGALHRVPMSALWDGEQFLVERFEMINLPSAGLLGRGRRARGTADTPTGLEANSRALVVGVADDFAPRIEDEARAVAERLAPCDQLLGAEATAERVSARAPLADVLHLACHALFAADNPQGSGLKLADRWLSLREIYDLRLKAELVVLSGCETGRHAVAAGDELVGLLRGFLVAGAAAVLVSLWSVHDECTSALMTCLYNEWRSGAKADGPAGSLRAAQLAARQTYPHPAFWAPFVLIGGL